MTGYALRRATPEDIGAIAGQIAASYVAAYRGQMDETYLATLSPETWTPLLTKSFSGGDVCIVAEEDGEIVGSSIFGRSNNANCPEDAELYTIYLLPEQIGRGLGHMLYAEVERAMIEAGFHHCTLEVLSSNERAIRFYTAHGFQKTNSFSVAENGMTLACELMRKALTEVD